LIAEEDEPHRLKGEPLSPRFSLESRSKHKERIGEYLWAAQFQQKPVAESGKPAETLQMALLAASRYEPASGERAERQGGTV
jgi:hypothetical protein